MVSKKESLKEIIAEHYYLVATNYKPAYPFSEQDSDVRDFYYEVAREELPKLLSGYFTQGKSQRLYNFLSGCVDDFVNNHGERLTKQNRASLVKRIVSRFPALTKQMFNKED